MSSAPKLTSLLTEVKVLQYMQFCHQNSVFFKSGTSYSYKQSALASFLVKEVKYIFENRHRRKVLLVNFHLNSQSLGDFLHKLKS